MLKTQTEQMDVLRGRLVVLTEATPLDAGFRGHLLESLHELAFLNTTRAVVAAQLVADYEVAGIKPDEAAAERFLDTVKKVYPNGACGTSGVRFADWKSKVAAELKILQASLAKTEKAE